MRGVIRFFNQQKGFGFVDAEGGKVYFFHHSFIAPSVQIVDDKFDLDAFEPCEFEPSKNDRG
jgi:hypothetical protein